MCVETVGLDKAMEIDLIREYRTRLIADVVTGKVDVRNIPIEESEKDEIPEENLPAAGEELEDTGELEEAIDSDE